MKKSERKKKKWNTRFELWIYKNYWSKSIAGIFNNYFVAIAENVKRQIKNNLINDDNNSIDNHTYFTKQSFNKLYPKYGT